MDLASYAELAERLVNSDSLGHSGADQLATLDDLRVLVADREHLNHGVTRQDLAELRALREEFRAFFAACAAGNGADAADRLNSLMIQHPVYPQLSGHDGQPWPELRVDRFGTCQAAPCRGVFIDTTRERTRRYCSERCAERATART